MQNFCDKMDSFLYDYYKANKNSEILRVTVRDEVIHKKFIGYADIENKTEFSKDYMFTLYSLQSFFLQ